MPNTLLSVATLKSGVALTALLLLPVSTVASEISLDEIIVIANRSETEAGKVGSTTHVITEEDLKNDGASFITEYLSKLPGISYSRNGGAGRATTLRMRGLKGQYIKVLVDGIDIADPTGLQVEARLEHMMLADVERIEILKGSQSALYGGQAIGGVINIITKRAEPGTVQHNLTAEGGSYGTANASYGFKAASETADLAVNIQRFHSDGFSAVKPNGREADDDSYDNTTISAKGSYDITQNLNLYLVGRGTDAYGEYDSSKAPNAHNKNDFRQYVGKLGANIAWFDDQLTTDASVQLTHVTRKIKDNNPKTLKGKRYKFDLFNTYDVTDALVINFGSDWMHEDYTKFGTSQIFGGFVEALIEASDDLNFAVSSWFDHHSRFGNYWSGRATTSYQLLDNTRFRSSFGNGFRAPSLNELFSEWGDTSLKPETSLSFDVGIDQELLAGKLRFGATYFHILTEDLIAYDTATNKYAQIKGLSRSQGAEFSANWDVLDNLSLNGAYTYTWALGPDKKRQFRVPLHDVNFGVTYKPIEALTLNLNASYVAGVDDTIYVGFVPKRVELDDFVLVNAKASYQYNENLRFHVRGENLLDQDYERARDYQTPGLSVYAGLSATF